MRRSELPRSRARHDIDHRARRDLAWSPGCGSPLSSRACASAEAMRGSAAVLATQQILA